LATIRDVAYAAGVSVATVSRVLNKSPRVSPKTLAKVNAAMRELDFEPNAMARGLASRRSGVIGVLVDQLGGGYFATIVDAIESHARKRSIDTLISCGNESATEMLASATKLALRHCDAVIASVAFMTEQELKALIRIQPNVVLINYAGEAFAERSLCVDNHYGVKLALDHLYRNGHRQIGIMTGPAENIESRLRLAAVKAWFGQHDLELSQRQIVCGEFSAVSARQATHQLLEQYPQVSAIFCFNDQMAMGAMMYLHQRGVQLPQELSLIGFDDIEWAQFTTPGLTTVAQPLDQLGRAAVDLAMHLIQGEPLTPPPFLLPELQVRGSVMPRPMEHSPSDSM